SHFIRLGEGSVGVTLASLRKETLDLPKLTLKHIDVNLVKEMQKANYRVILDNVAQLEALKPSEEEKPSEKKQKRYIIHEVLIQDVTANIDLLPIGGELTKLTV